MIRSDVTRPSLLVRLRDMSNQNAWEDFVRLYTPLIYGYLRQRGLQEADAADVAQEVLKSVAGAIERFTYNPEQGKFRSWLLTITRNKLNNYFARQQRVQFDSGTQVFERLAEQPSLEELSAWDQDFRRRVFQCACEQARGEVTPKTWQAFWETAVEGRRGEEVAEALGISVGAVYVARSRLTSRLRAIVADLGEDAPPDLEGVIA